MSSNIGVINKDKIIPEHIILVTFSKYKYEISLSYKNKINVFLLNLSMQIKTYADKAPCLNIFHYYSFFCNNGSNMIATIFKKVP